MSRILALDPRTEAIGWADMDTEAESLLLGYGVQPIEGDNLDEQIAHAVVWLSEMVRERLTEITAIEKPVMHRDIKKRNVATTIILAQLVGALRYAAFPYTERIIMIHPRQRLSALGLPQLRSQQAKRAVVHHVNAEFGLELKLKDHDAADAIAIGLAAMRELKLEAWNAVS